MGLSDDHVDFTSNSVISHQCVISALVKSLILGIGKQTGPLGSHYSTREQVLVTGRLAKEWRMIVVFNYTYGTVI